MMMQDPNVLSKIVFKHFCQQLKTPWKIYSDCSKHIQEIFLRELVLNWDNLPVDDLKPANEQDSSDLQEEDVDVEDGMRNRKLIQLKIKASFLLSIICLNRKTIKHYFSKDIFEKIFQVASKDEHEFVKSLAHMTRHFYDDPDNREDSESSSLNCKGVLDLHSENTKIKPLEIIMKDLENWLVESASEISVPLNSFMYLSENAKDGFMDVDSPNRNSFLLNSSDVNINIPHHIPDESQRLRRYILSKGNDKEIIPLKALENEVIEDEGVLNQVQMISSISTPKPLSIHKSLNHIQNRSSNDTNTIKSRAEIQAILNNQKYQKRGVVSLDLDSVKLEIQKTNDYDQQCSHLSECKHKNELEINKTRLRSNVSKSTNSEKSWLIEMEEKSDEEFIPEEEHAKKKKYQLSKSMRTLRKRRRQDSQVGDASLNDITNVVSTQLANNMDIEIKRIPKRQKCILPILYKMPSVMKEFKVLPSVLIKPPYNNLLSFKDSVSQELKSDPSRIEEVLEIIVKIIMEKEANLMSNEDKRIIIEFFLGLKPNDQVFAEIKEIEIHEELFVDSSRENTRFREVTVLILNYEKHNWKKVKRRQTFSVILESIILNNHSILKQT